MMNALARFRLRARALLVDTRGAQMVEYIVIVGACALFAIAAYKTFGGDIESALKAEGKTLKGVAGAQ